MRTLPIWMLVAAATLAACTSEETTPVDLQPTTTVTIDDPNAGVRAEAQGYANQQCLDDPELDEGLIEILDPQSEEVVGRITADCYEVRNDR